MIFLTGQVGHPDGSVLTEPAPSKPSARTEAQETHTIAWQFQFQFGGISALPAWADFDANTRSECLGVDLTCNLHDCELQARSPDLLRLNSLGEDFLATRAQTLTSCAAPARKREGFTISATTGQAGRTRKALEKSQEQQKKSKWDDAQKSLEKAVTIYQNLPPPGLNWGGCIAKMIPRRRHSFNSPRGRLEIYQSLSRPDAACHARREIGRS